MAIIKSDSLFREEATSALAGFHAGPLTRSNWNSQARSGGGGGDWRTRRKTLGARTKTNDKLNPQMAKKHEILKIDSVINIICFHFFVARKLSLLNFFQVGKFENDIKMSVVVTI